MSTIRFTGLASGLDTEAIVKELMKSHKEPMNRLIRQKQKLEWKQEAYREMNSALLELRTAVDSMRFSSKFNKKVSSSENDNIVSSKVVGTPKLNNYVVEVRKLAKAEMPASVALNVDSSIKSSTQKVGKSFTMSVNGEEISVSADDTIDDIISQIKQKTDGAIEGSFIGGQLILSSAKKTNDAGNDITIDNFKVELVDGDGSSLGLTVGTPKESLHRIPGEEAEVVINGVLYKSSTNKITFDGVEFTLKQVNEGSAISVSNQVDEDAVFETIKNFVNKYNEIIEKINKKISEPQYRGYTPLLDDEKEAMTESQVTKWENLAKSGLLLRDSILSNGLTEMRRAMSTPLSGSGVNPAFDTLAEIGITGAPNGKYAYQENGKLYIDEDKLRAAIRNNGEEVQKLFTRYSNASDAATKFNESGIADRLYSVLTQVINKVTSQAGSTTSVYDDSYLGKQIKETDAAIDQWEDRLKEIEDRYYKQFAKMETLMSKAQSQLSWYSQLLSS